MAGAVGTATLNFGAAPGTNIVSVVVTGQASITGTSSVEAFMMGTDSTATHNTYEHSMVSIRLSCIAIAAGTGFTIQGISETRLTGTFVIRWVWSD